MGTIVTLAVIGIMTSGTFSVGATLLNLTKMIVIGILVGLVLSYVISLLITESKFGIFRQSAPIISLVIVLITYVVAQALGGSGYMAAFVAGMVCGNKHKLNLYVPDESHKAQTYFRDTIATIMKMMIFILLGTHVNFQVLSEYFWVTLVATAMLVFIARPVSVFVSTAFDFKAGWSLKDKLFMSWVRETGVIPAVMCSLIVSMKLPGSELVSSIVFMVILITLILQGSTTQKVAEKLGVLENAGEKHATPHEAHAGKKGYSYLK
jgi:NhaP-type Na+/H+ or K+/H+ antiporter